jgi:hypothetical protein
MSELKVNTISPFNSTSISVNTPGGLIVSGDLSSSNGNVLIGNYSMASAPNNAATSKYYVDQQFAVRGLSASQVGASQQYVDSAIGTLSSSLPNIYLVKSSITGQIHSGGGLTFSSGPYTFGSGGLLLNVDTSTNTVGVGATAPYSASGVKLHVVGTIGLGNASNPSNPAQTSRLYNDASNFLVINGYNQVNLQVGGTTKITSTSATTTFSTSNQIVVSDITDSSSTPTGALTVAGGVGVAKNLSVGGSLGVASGVTFTNSTDSSSTTTGALVVSGGVGVAKNLSVGGSLSVASVASGVTFTNSTDSSSTTTGALVVSGGVGVAKKLWVGGTINAIGGLTASGATFTGLITLAGATSSALISCATTPTQGQHLANKTYVDSRTEATVYTVAANTSVTFDINDMLIGETRIYTSITATSATVLYCTATGSGGYVTICGFTNTIYALTGGSVSATGGYFVAPSGRNGSWTSSTSAMIGQGIFSVTITRRA